MGRVESGQQPPWSRPKRDVAPGRLEGLVRLGVVDPDDGVRLTAEHMGRTVVAEAP